MRSVRPLAGTIANATGFLKGLSPETAASAAACVFIAFLPPAVVGCVAGWRTAKCARRGRRPFAAIFCDQFRHHQASSR
jgi:hypothetical protein